ncbi:MAG: protein-L-isoaspartate O-methyltransferase [Pseudomonadota bacterium]|jgi:protein-L-isoaspartate(D-aspartate) O-methyltransferase
MNDKPTVKSTVKPSFPAKMDLSVGKGVSTHLQAQVSKPAQPFQLVKNSIIAKALPSAPTVPHGLGMDSSTFRARMVSKLMNHGITDQRVLNAMQATHRHSFVDTALANQAYEDTSLPIGWGQTISKPNVVARMIELLFEGKTGNLGRVLEIGTGCGYQAAVLSHIAHEVYSIERVAGLYEKARENFRPFRIKNTHLLFGDGMLGFPKGAPYAGIIAAAGGDAIPQAWIDQLAVGGRIVAPVTNKTAGEQSLVVVDKTETGLKRTVLELVQFVPLKSGVI